MTHCCCQAASHGVYTLNGCIFYTARGSAPGAPLLILLGQQLLLVPNHSMDTRAALRLMPHVRKTERGSVRLLFARNDFASYPLSPGALARPHPVQILDD